MSYGGSHILVEFVALGIVSAIGSSRRGVERRKVYNEFVGF
jgi:cell division protein FtsW (lipid II flippase)